MPHPVVFFWRGLRYYCTASASASAASLLLIFKPKQRKGTR